MIEVKIRDSCDKEMYLNPAYRANACLYITAGYQ